MLKNNTICWRCISSLTVVAVLISDWKKFLLNYFENFQYLIFFRFKQRSFTVLDIINASFRTLQQGRHFNSLKKCTVPDSVKFREAYFFRIAILNKPLIYFDRLCLDYSKRNVNWNITYLIVKNFYNFKH